MSIPCISNKGIVLRVCHDEWTVVVVSSTLFQRGQEVIFERFNMPSFNYFLFRIILQDLSDWLVFVSCSVLPCFRLLPVEFIHSDCVSIRPAFDLSFDQTLSQSCAFIDIALL